MDIRKIQCDICGKDIGNIPNDEKEHVMIGKEMHFVTNCFRDYGDENIIFSNYPTFVNIDIKGHGTLSDVTLNYDICEECLWNGIVINQIDKNLRIYSRKEIPRNAER